MFYLTFNEVARSCSLVSSIIYFEYEHEEFIVDGLVERVGRD